MSDNTDQSLGDLFPDLGQETPIISGVAHDNSESLVTVRGVTDEPGMAGRVFTRLAELGVNVDMIVQAGASTGTADISFTIPGSDAARVETALTAAQDTLGYKSFDVNPNVGKVAVVGVGMKTHSGLAARFLGTERGGHQRAHDLHLRDPHRRPRAALAAQRRRACPAQRVRSGRRQG